VRLHWCRLGEILQLRRSDVREEDGIWAIHITPRAGDTKTDLPRWVPLHEHLIAQGFVAWVQAQQHERLSYRAPDDTRQRISPAYQSAYKPPAGVRAKACA
jgi:integrase